ncbi:MAG: hypothetical protein RL758_102 [Pseudomonadota bacterium]|jgi:hypothetical protein
MTYLSEPKDPAEVVTIGFDFSVVTDTPSDPDISIAVRWGHGHHHTELVASGDPIIEGAKVFQRFTAGTDLHDYDLKCLAYTPTGDRISVDCTLAVRTRPV